MITKETCCKMILKLHLPSKSNHHLILQKIRFLEHHLIAAPTLFAPSSLVFFFWSSPHSIDRVCVGSGFRVFPPNFDSFVGLARDEASAGMVKRGGINSSFQFEGTRLNGGGQRLEWVTRLEVLNRN